MDRMRHSVGLVAAATLVALPFDAARSQEVETDGGSAEARAELHVETARRLAGTDLTPTFDFFCVPGNARPNNFSAPPLTPVRLFDNLYALGNSETVVYAITTSEGIVLIDAGVAAEVEPVLLPGFMELGLDPADVELVLLGHGHSDHYGGASHFQTRYGARVGTTEADWRTIVEAAASGRPGATPAPSRDLTVREGEPVVLGDTTITLIEIPGHTPGALAFIFSVRDGGATHVAGLFGGTVLATAYTPAEGLERYIGSIGHFLEVAAKERVDVEIQNHPIFDDTPSRLAALAARAPGEPHPFVMGADRYQRFWGVVSECMQADIARKSSR
jgi:metallo-beta-lactamase class B